nr:hypothetical protein CFP56_70974 [Quercus suber]
MPFYEIQHSTPLTVSQRDALAEGLTTLHATTFTTPRLFVNVGFQDTRTTAQYVGGKPRRGMDNHVRVYARTGPGRTAEDWAGLCRGVEKVWREVVGPGLPRVRRGEGPMEEGAASLGLRSVVVIGALVAGIEMGFVLPEAGGDEAWVERNWEEFRRRAGEGEEEFVDLVKDVEERGLMKGGKKTEAELDKERARKLEELMGWGDE